MLFVPTPRTIQPGSPVRVAGRWRSRCISAWYANANCDVVRSVRLTLNGTAGSREGGRISCAGNSLGANYFDIGTISTPADVTRFSMLAIATPRTLLSRYSLFSIEDNGGGGSFSFNEGYNDSSKAFCYNTTSNYTGEIGPSGFFTAGQRAVYGVSYNKNTNVVVAYKNGVGYSGSFNNAANINYAMPACPGGRAASGGLVVQWNGTIELIAIFPYELTAAEFALLSINPWRELFEPLPALDVGFSVSAGAVTKTYAQVFG